MNRRLILRLAIIAILAFIPVVSTTTAQTTIPCTTATIHMDKWPDCLQSLGVGINLYNGSAGYTQIETLHGEGDAPVTYPLGYHVVGIVLYGTTVPADGQWHLVHSTDPNCPYCYEVRVSVFPPPACAQIEINAQPCI